MNTRLIGFAIWALLLSAAAVSSAVASIDLEDYRWRYRLLLIFAPSAETKGVESARLAIGQRRAAILDRDMQVFFVFERTIIEADTEPLVDPDTASLRRRFGIGQGEQAMILVGKDGGEKLRVPLEEDLSTIFRLIDGMPMRQDEIEQKRRAGRPVTPP